MRAHRATLETSAAEAPRLIISPKPWPWLTPLRAALLISVVALAYGLSMLHFHSITWDSPSLFYAGERTLYWFGHKSNPDALNLTGPEVDDFKSHFTRYSPNPDDPVHYPVLPALIGAITTSIFCDTLHWVQPIDGQHMGLVLMHVLGLFLFTLYACRLLGRGAGIAAGVVLATYPSGVGHSFNNAKDWPCALFYCLSVLAAGVGVLKERGRHLLAAGLFLGISFACKFNSVFVFPTLVLWAPIGLWARRMYSRGVPSVVMGGFLGAPYVAAAVFILLWPWVYQGGPANWLDHIHEYLHFMVSFGFVERPYWTALPLKIVGWLSPPLVDLAALVGFFFGRFGGRNRFATWALVVIGIGVPILRVSVPNTNFYDANRHFIEYVPFLAALAGLGSSVLMTWAWGLIPKLGALGEHLTPTRLLAVGAAVGLCGVIWPIAAYAPYETTYWNFTMGGLGGAQATAPYLMMPVPSDHREIGTEGDYWDNSVRMAIRELMKDTPATGISLGLCGPWGHVVQPVLDELGLKWKLEGYGEGDFDKAQRVLAIPRETACGCARFWELESHRPLIHREMRGGGVIYEVFGPKDGKPHEKLFPDNPYCHDDYALTHD